MRMIALLVMAIACRAQVMVTFSPQGPEALRTLTGKLVPGEQIVAVEICSPAPASIPSGLVYQTAVRNGLSAQSPALARAIVARTVAGNWRNRLIEGVAVATATTTVLGASGTVHMTTTWTAGLATGHVFWDMVTPLMRARIPDPSPLLGALLDPNSTTALVGSGCREEFMAALFRPDQKALLGPFELK